MGYTDHCDLYAAVHEDGINLVAQHVMRQRPSWFNYATQYVSDHPQLGCVPVAHTLDVTHYSNPLFKVVSPVPILGTAANSNARTSSRPSFCGPEHIPRRTD